PGAGRAPRGRPAGEGLPPNARPQRPARGRDRLRAGGRPRDARPDRGRRGHGPARAGRRGGRRAADRPRPPQDPAGGARALRGLRPRPARHDRLGGAPAHARPRGRRHRHPRSRARVHRQPLHRPGRAARAGCRPRPGEPPGAAAGVRPGRDREALRRPGIRLMPQTGYTHRPVAMGRDGMVAAAHPLATLTGVEVLKAGGTAADAAVAVNAVLAVSQPNMCGVGGDLFCLYYEAATRRVHFLNGAGRSGSRAGLDELRHRGLPRLPVVGPPTVSVPGCVRAWGMLLERFGTKPLAELVAPAIHYAGAGFPISALTSQAIQEFRVVTGDPEWHRVFAPDGRVPPPGARFVQSDLARTLRDLAAEGPDLFYTGRVAGAIAARMAPEGFLTREDLARVPVSALLSKDYAARRRRDLDEDKARAYAFGDPEGDTTGFVVADGRGDVISVIQSLFNGFGSGVVAPGTGVVLQNRGRHFSLEPGHPALFAPRQRPVHPPMASLATRH